MQKSVESRTRRDEQRRKYSKMDKRAKDKLIYIYIYTHTHTHTHTVYTYICVYVCVGFVYVKFIGHV